MDVEPRKKLDGRFFNLKDLSETTSSISPYQLKDVIKYVYPKNTKCMSERINSNNRRRLKK